jgi:hypothetical protein
VTPACLLPQVTLGHMGGTHELGLHEGMHGRVHMHFVHNAAFFDEPYQDGTVEFRLRTIAILAKVRSTHSHPSPP